ncbi:MAG TPA: ParB N-terminal domain-containing protein [Pirellulales bacterium]|jgi:hypothetical protein|nr:ParB N-terminal domain-containing protein [Pirellulales bacterium]
MQIRDRVKELRRVRAAELRPNPRNWRLHPAAQQDALRGILADVGFASALVARELADGSLQLIDGHLRAETAPDAIVPVLVLDVDAAEADKLLAALDPLAALAETNSAALDSLLAEVRTDHAALQTLFAELASQADHELRDSGLFEPPQSTPEMRVPELFQLVVECASEEQQQTLFERLSHEGWKCRLMNL